MAVRKRRELGTKRKVRIIAANGAGMTGAEAERFLAESRSVIKLGTVDASGDPMVHPVWYCFEPGRGLYAMVGSGTRKLANIEKRRRLYFLVDDDRWPYRGVRGKGEATVLPKGPEAMAIVEKIVARYIKKDHPLFQQYYGGVENGSYVVVRIAPRYLSTWDYGKMPRSVLSAGLK